MNCFLNSTKKTDIPYQFNCNYIIDPNTIQVRPSNHNIHINQLSPTDLQLSNNQIYEYDLNNQQHHNSHQNNQQIVYLNENIHLNSNDLPIDVDSFVANLPNLEEFDSLQTNNNQNINQTSNDNSNSTSNLVDHQHNHQLININQNQYQYQYSSYDQNHQIQHNESYFFSQDNQHLIQPQKISNVEFSKVDILNQILQSNSSNLSSSSSTSSASSLSSSYLSSTPSSYSSSSISLDQIPNEYNQDQSPNCNSNKKKVSDNNFKSKIKRKEEKNVCNVCGHKSSGYHYGSYTCEACKLFFRRAEKNIRKTGFSECKTKNCQIKYENRSNCSECRYKKCIAVGMAMTRSRFGRHTQQQSSNYVPDVTNSLQSLITGLKAICTKQNVDFDILNNLILEFYYKTKKLMTNNNDTVHEATNLDYNLQQAPGTYMQNSTLSELSYLINNKPSDQFNTFTRLPNCVLILFCVLFEININSTDPQVNRIINGFETYLHDINEKVFKINKFNLTLKIGIYLKCLNNHLLKVNIKHVIDSYNKRIMDLLRSELALFKFESPINELNLNEVRDSNDLNQINQRNMKSLMTRLNSVIMENMTEYEIELFFAK